MYNYNMKLFEREAEGLEAPIYNKLIQYYKGNRISFAMPGHKSGRGLAENLLNCDVTELHSTIDLFCGGKEVGEANKLLAKLYGSEESRIVTEGSSAAIHAMLAASLKPGETLLSGADCHKSVVNACALCGFNIRLFTDIGDAALMLDKYSDIKAVMVTSPDYYGVCKNIPALSKVCHERGIPLLVDEAHGAHFPASGKLPDSAMRQGADIVCQSAHKTLNALTGAAYLHMQGNLADKDRLWRALETFSSTSPSYVIAASADLARAQLQNSDEWEKLFYLCEEFKRKIIDATDVTFMENDDFSRIVLDFQNYETSGFEIDEILSEKYGIDAEMSDNSHLVLIATASNTEADFSKLFDAVCSITSGLVPGNAFVPETPPVCKTLIKPSEAFYAKQEAVSLYDSIGRIACGAVTPYPPGIPVIMPGGVITAEQTDYIYLMQKNGAKITGIDNGYIQCVKTRCS